MEVKNILETLKLLSLFSGIGAPEKALKRLNINYELVNYCEIDKYASKAYSLIHNEPESKNLGDITKVNEKILPDFDMMTWGFPCTDISNAGQQKGFIDENGNKTRSGLYYDGLRILKEKKPKYSIIENVKALTSKKFESEFTQILSDLNEAGYNNYFQVLNSKDYGIPQHRERIFIISIRKDIDNTYEFPKGYDNGLRLIDLLEDSIEQKHYVNDERTQRMLEDFINQDKNPGIYTGVYKQTKGFQERDVSCTIDANYYKGLGNFNENRTAIVEIIPDYKFDLSEKELAYMNRQVSDGRTHWDFQHHHDIQDGIAHCLPANLYKGVPYNVIKTYTRIRKLTPLECFRLFGFDDQDCYILKENKISDTQIYKMAGNSIVVDVIVHIIKNIKLQLMY